MHGEIHMEQVANNSLRLRPPVFSSVLGAEFVVFQHLLNVF